MRNACIIIKTEKSVLSKSDFTIPDYFTASGYFFEELRVLFFAEETKLKASVTQLKAEVDNILLITCGVAASTIKNALSGIFSEASFQGNVSGTGVFAEENKALLLLESTDIKYAKEVCVPFLQRKSGVRLAKTVVRSVGANGSRVAGLLAQAERLAQGKIAFSHTRKYDEDIIEIVYGESVSKFLIDDILRVFADGLGDTLYALEDISLAEQLVALLKLRGRKISVAESFTGGGIAKRITAVSGASAVYFEGLNTYNEISKMKRLGVSEYTLKTVGAVSDQTAYEMAAGLIATGDCDISIATTGLAGPNTDRSMLPVGLCYIAVGVKERVFVYRYKFDGTREDITETAINYALYLAYKQLKNM
ncbi:MAG: CinA family protein [Clostridia bacterium]|nr:CinA family protein [Clostridia bacterium]